MTISTLLTADPMLAAAIDIGSNAIRLRICGLDGENNLETIHYHREAVRLGKDAFTTGYLSEAIMTDAEHAFQNFRNIIDKYHIKNIRAVATSALRDAKNSDLLIQRIQQKTSITIEVISGDEEGELIHSAIHHQVDDLASGTALLIDIGGGSVEITLSINGEITSIESYKAGTVRLIESFRESDGNYNVTLLKQHIHALQQKIKKQIAGQHIDFCIGTGGNIEALGELGFSLLNTTSPTTISHPNLKILHEKINALSYKQRTKELQLRPDRADVIIPASLILTSVMQLAQPAQLSIPKVGLADGILITLLTTSQRHAISREHQAIRWATTLARKFHVNLRHAEYVRNLSCKIFTQLSTFHDFHTSDYVLLQMAALLHETGKFIRVAGHQRHAYYIINASPIIGLTSEEKSMVASIVRYQRKRIPSESHAPFCQHTTEDQQRLLQLTSILRLAISFNKERKYNIDDIRCQHTTTSVNLYLIGKGSHILSAWTAQKQQIWFQSAFQKSLFILDDS